MKYARFVGCSLKDGTPMNHPLRKLLSCLLAAAAILLLASCAGSSAALEEKDTQPTITVGCDNYSPFSYMNADGTITGIDVDLAKEAFHRMGYEPDFVFINWEDKKKLLQDGSIDCIWSSFTMNGRESEYNWAGPYMESRQVVVVNTDSEINTLQDLANKTVAVQSTTKPEDIFRAGGNGIPKLHKLISVQQRDLIFVMLSKGYVDAIAAHDTAVDQFMAETGLEFQILEDPLQTVGLGVAFDKTNTSGIDQQLTQTLDEMRADGTTEKIIGNYLPNAAHYLENLS